jgi:hypothetical protein
VNVEERVLIQLTYTDGRVDGSPDWNVVCELARHNAVEPLVAHNLKRLGLPVPAELQAKAEEVRLANDARLRVAKELFAKFGKIPVVILKGVLFAETIYRNPYYKKMNDVDILVRREDLDAIYAIYDEMRFFSAAELTGSKKKQEKWSHHAPPFFSRDLKCMIGTHWGLITPLSPYRLDYDAIWSRVRDIDFYGHPAKSMAPEDNLHHLCVHLPYYKCGLRELADLYNLIRTQPVDWDLFLREVEKARTENLVYHALGLAQRVSPTTEAGEVLRRIEPRVASYYRRDTAAKTASLSRLLRARSVHLSRIEKAFADLRATRKPGEKWEAFARMWKHMLFVPAEDVARMNSLDHATVWARLRTPGRIRRVFYRDVGRLFFWLIMTKCAVDVITSPFKQDREDHEAFARKIGVTVDDLRRLKEALE